MRQAQALAAGDGKAQIAAEVSALADEAEMPLEQLLMQCGYVIPGGSPELVAGGDGTMEAADVKREANAEGDDGANAAAGESPVQLHVLL